MDPMPGLGSDWLARRDWLRGLFWRDFKKGTGAICDAAVCTARCALKSFVGVEPGEVLITVANYDVQRRIKTIARAYGEAAAKAVGRAIAWPMTAAQSGQTIYCTIKCE